MTDPNTPDGATPPPAYPPAAPEPYASAPPAAYGAPAQATVPGRTMGIVAFILSFFAQLIALILGIIALVQSKKAGQKNGFALAAIIISSVLIVVGIIVAIILIAAFAAVGGSDLTSQIQACIDNGGTGTVQWQGVTMTCEELLEQSGQ